VRGRLLRRYKRFFADVETPDGETLVTHCPNPGSMLGLATPGLEVRCSVSDNPRRKLSHTLEMVRVGRAWVGVHTTRANGIAALALASGHLPALAGYTEIRREVAVGDGARLDFRLSGHAKDPRPAFVEVKSVTLARGRAARFPDSVTERGRRHLEVLTRLRAEGARACLLFVVQRADCAWVEPADEIDPAYGRALRDAAAAGVELFALRTRVSPERLSLDELLPVRL
jgi:sugar fermentation stimulation protein A